MSILNPDFFFQQHMGRFLPDHLGSHSSFSLFLWILQRKIDIINLNFLLLFRNKVYYRLTQNNSFIYKNNNFLLIKHVFLFPLKILLIFYDSHI